MRATIPVASREGSSPLARGGPDVHVRTSDLRGLIPARAGRTGELRTAARSAGAHPRSRGADKPTLRNCVPYSGSSPLARGGQSLADAQLVDGGLIPARAGRTSAFAPGAAHAVGSSPLARGGPPGLRVERRLTGLIPARAGRTSRQTCRCRSTRAHPRSRGADALYQALRQGEAGSSPLARGGPGQRDGNAALPGLIPARAGRTTTATWPRRRRRAHPRSRGADTAILHPLGGSSGSSPLARGGQPLYGRCEPPRGLIPARAGRTR